MARALAVCSYKSSDLFEERYGRKPNRNGEDPWAATTESGHAAGLHGGRFEIAGYLDYQGDRFNERFDANSYLVMTRMMDTFDPSRGFASAPEAYGRIRARVTLVGISSDWLFPPADIVALSYHLSEAGVRCDYRELFSSHGHDAFLAEFEELVRLLNAES